MDTLKRYPYESVVSLIERCQQRASRSRVVGSIASFQPRGQPCPGLGSVINWVADTSANWKAPRWRVGGALPERCASTIHLCRGDTLIFATDGVESEFAEDITINNSPQKMADRILLAHMKQEGDAMIPVARSLGDGA